MNIGMGEQPTVTVEVDLNYFEAEELLTGLAWRAQQKGMGSGQQIEIDELGRKLSKIFEAKFGWEPGCYERVRFGVPRIITVQVKP